MKPKPKIATSIHVRKETRTRLEKIGKANGWTLGVAMNQFLFFALEKLDNDAKKLKADNDAVTQQISLFLDRGITVALDNLSTRKSWRGYSAVVRALVVLYLDAYAEAVRAAG